jgi:hypothetical protein
VEVCDHSIEHQLYVIVLDVMPGHVLGVAVTASVRNYDWCEGPVFLVVVANLEIQEIR